MRTNMLGLFAAIVVALSAAGAETPAPGYASEGARVVGDLAAGKFENVSARFDARLEKDLPPAKLSALWREMLAKAGPFRKVTAAEVTAKPGGYHAVAMTCAFEHVPQGDALVTLDGGGRIAGLYFGPRPTEEAKQWGVPGYAAPERFQEVPVTVTTGPWHLPGTLTLPKASGPFPAAVLVPGSPPVDQDETIGPNKIFKDLAWGLASRGVAVLRYTKRTCQFGAGLGGGFASSFSVREEVADDARAALALLAARPDVDRRRTYLVGHSLGGLAATLVAAEDPRASGVVLVGTPASDLVTLLLERAEAAGPGGKAPGADASSLVQSLKKIRSGEADPGGTIDIAGGRTPAGYFLELRNYEPGPAAAKLKIPTLVLLAGHDSQVPPKEAERWKKELTGKKDATLKVYPGLFHLFMPSTSTEAGDTPADWGRPAHVSREAVDDVASWIASGGRK
jgi:dienelactone hydrolase